MNEYWLINQDTISTIRQHLENYKKYDQDAANKALILLDLGVHNIHLSDTNKFTDLYDLIYSKEIFTQLNDEYNNCSLAILKYIQQQEGKTQSELNK